MMKWEMERFIRILMDKRIGLEEWEITSMGRMMGIIIKGMGGMEGREEW